MGLTIGQVIDQLKQGQIARSVNPIDNMVGYYFIKKEPTGFYTYTGYDENVLNNYDQMKMEQCYFLFKWKVLPQFISYKDAIKTLAEGTTIQSHTDDGVVYDKYKSVYDLYKLEESEISDMKWSVVKKGDT